MNQVTAIILTLTSLTFSLLALSSQPKDTQWHLKIEVQYGK